MPACGHLVLSGDYHKTAIFKATFNTFIIKGQTEVWEIPKFCSFLVYLHIVLKAYWKGLNFRKRGVQVNCLIGIHSLVFSKNLHHNECFKGSIIRFELKKN